MAQEDALAAEEARREQEFAERTPSYELLFDLDDLSEESQRQIFRAVDEQ